MRILIRSLQVLGLTVAVLAGAVFYFAVTPLPRPDIPHTSPVWIGPVHVVDVADGTVHPDQVLRIEGGRIADILPAEGMDPSIGGGLLNMGGAYVVPGLWDMHALLIRYAPALDYPLHLAHGVTRVRNILNCAVTGAVELYPCQPEKRVWNAAVASGGMVGPLVMESGSYPINGPAWKVDGQPDVFDAATPDRTREMVRLISADPDRPDHLKAYDDIPRESYFALVEEGLANGIRTNGHVPLSVSLTEAVEAGHQAIAHARTLPIACTDAEAEIMAMRVAGTPRSQWMALALDRFSRDRCAGPLAAMRAHGTFLSPTLVTRWNETAEGVAWFKGDPDVARWTPWLLGLIQSEDIGFIEGQTAEIRDIYRRFYDIAAGSTAAAEQAGVRLLAGTDSHDLGILPGLGLHHEVALWRDAGIPNAAILRALTMNAAAYAGREGDMGQVAEGFVADLVFVAGNPLEDISLLRRPVAVMQAGRMYDRAALDGMLAAAEATASGWRFTVHMLRDMAWNPAGFVR